MPDTLLYRFNPLPMKQQNQLPDGVVYVDYIKPGELQHILRQFEQLEGINVTVPNIIQPWVYKLMGAISCYGDLKVYEVHVNAASIRSADNIIEIVEKLRASFEQARKQIADNRGDVQ